MEGIGGNNFVTINKRYYEMNKYLQDSIQYEITNKLEALNCSLSSIHERLSTVVNMPINSSAKTINDFMFDNGVDKDDEPSIYIGAEYLEVCFYLRTSYDNIIGNNDAQLSHNANWVSVELEEIINEIKFSVSYEIRVPEDVKELLVACEKLVTTSVPQTSMIC
jgi:hypothetical protein